MSKKDADYLSTLIVATVVTLIKVGDNYLVKADKDGVIFGRHSMDSALSEYQTPGVINSAHILAYSNHRLHEIVGDFETTAKVIRQNVVDTKLHRHKDVYWNFFYGYLLKPEIGTSWYEQATPAIV